MTDPNHPHAPSGTETEGFRLSRGTLLRGAAGAMVDRYCYLTYVFDPPDRPVPVEESVAVLEHIWSSALGIEGD